jgi:hypothetical protein
MAKAREHGDRRTHRTECRRKVRHRSRQAAQRHADRLWRFQAARVRVYRCGDHWHVGHDRRR